MLHKKGETRGGGRFNFPPVDDTLIIDDNVADLTTSDRLGTAMILLLGLAMLRPLPCAGVCRAWAPSRIGTRCPG